MLYEIYSIDNSKLHIPKKNHWKIKKTKNLMKKGGKQDGFRREQRIKAK